MAIASNPIKTDGEVTSVRLDLAELSGRTHRERAEELIRAAHPDFRDELTEAAENICQASKINDFLDIRTLKY